VSQSSEITPGAEQAAGAPEASDGSAGADVSDGADAGEASELHALLTEVIDETIERFGGGDYTERITAARQEYDGRRGRVFEDEELWEAWTQGFLEWYVIERVPGSAEAAEGPIAARGRPAVAQVLLDARGRGDARREAAARAWLASHRSLFEVRALSAGRVELLDLIGGAQFWVREPRAMLGVSVGDVAEMRLVGFDGEVLFGRTFCFHPAGTRDAIVAHVRQMRALGSARQDIVDFFASLRIRCERYRHVPPVRIYGAARPQPGMSDDIGPEA
jgi:hypothetical protein